MMNEKQYRMEMRSHGRTGEPLCWECSKKYKDGLQIGSGVIKEQIEATKEEAKPLRLICSECGKDAPRFRIIEEV